MKDVSVSRHLRKKPVLAPQPIKIRDISESKLLQAKYEARAVEERPLTPAEERAMDDMWKWGQWRGWTLKPFVAHGEVVTYERHYQTGMRGELVVIYYPEDDVHEYKWAIYDSDANLLRSGEADDFWGARTKADNLYQSLPFVAGWNSALRGRKLRERKSPEYKAGYRAYQEYGRMALAAQELEESPEDEEYAVIDGKLVRL